MISRRGFLGALIGGVASAAAVRTFPFRVFSFPTVVAEPTFDLISSTTLADLREDILYDNFFVDTPWMSRLRSYAELEASRPNGQTRITNIEVPTDEEIEAYA